MSIAMKTAETTFTSPRSPLSPGSSMRVRFTARGEANTFSSLSNFSAKNKNVPLRSSALRNTNNPEILSPVSR